MIQYVDHAKEITADSHGGCHDGREEEETAFIVVVMLVIELLFDGGVECTIIVVVIELPVAVGVCV